MKKYARVVVTCGISVFGSGNAFRAWTADNNLLQFPSPSFSPTPQPPSAITDDVALDRLRQKISVLTASTSPVTDPKRVSAEYSGLSSLRAAGQLVDHPHVVLIHTATFGGKAAALILKKMLEMDFNAAVELREIRLNVNDRPQMRSDLGNFMQSVAEALRGYDQNSTAFFPLGGYKVMTSLGGLAGGKLGYPTLYLHEENQILHEVPGVPWELSESALLEIAPLLRKIGDGIEIPNLSLAERQEFEAFPWLFEQSNELVAVNAIGLFVISDNPHLFATTIEVAEPIKSEFEKDSRGEFILQQLDILAGKLSKSSTDSDLQHEKSWGLSSSEGWHAYKGASNGVNVFRAIYRYNRQENLLLVKAIWLDHVDYEREIKTAWGKPTGKTVRWSLP